MTFLFEVQLGRDAKTYAAGKAECTEHRSAWTLSPCVPLWSSREPIASASLGQQIRQTAGNELV